MMNLREFKNSLKKDDPPVELSDLMKAMWYAEKNHWNNAHRLAQEDASIDGSWVHAFLHRVEGDNSNATYWYARSGRSYPQISLEDEWENIVKYLLK